MLAFPYMVLFVWAIVLVYNCVHSLNTSGTFGWKNRFHCACRNGSCDPKTGSCPTGCRNGRYGHNCQLESGCVYDRMGVNYTGYLDEAEDGKRCLHWQEHSSPRYQFLPGDDPANYCRNPRSQTGYAERPWCYVTERGDFAFCALTKCDCPVGFYGPHCQLFCHCHKSSETCHGVSGACTSGCADGWIGLDCQTRCFPGKFGRHCERKCDICCAGSCDPETGKCMGNDEKHTYPALLKQCPDGYFGPDCLHQCQCRNQSEACHKVTGGCTSGCAHNMTELNCSKALDEGFTKSTKSTLVKTIIIPAGVSGVVVLLLLVGSILYCIHRRRRGCTSEGNTETVKPEDETADVNQETNTVSETGTDVNQRDISCQRRTRRKKLRSQTLPSPTPTESYFQPPSFFRSSQDLPRVFSTIGGFDIFGTASDEPGTSQYEDWCCAIRNMNDAKDGTGVSTPLQEGENKATAEEEFRTLKYEKNHSDLKDDTDVNTPQKNDSGTGEEGFDQYDENFSDTKDIVLDIDFELKNESAPQNITVAEIESPPSNRIPDDEDTTGVVVCSGSSTTCASPVKTRDGKERAKRVRITEYLDKTFWI